MAAQHLLSDKSQALLGRSLSERAVVRSCPVSRAAVRVRAEHEQVMSSGSDTLSQKVHVAKRTVAPDLSNPSNEFSLDSVSQYWVTLTATKEQLFALSATACWPKLECQSGQALLVAAL